MSKKKEVKARLRSLIDNYRGSVKSVQPSTISMVQSKKSNVRASIRNYERLHGKDRFSKHIDREFRITNNRLKIRLQNIARKEGEGLE